MLSLSQLVRKVYAAGFDAGKCAWNKPIEECILAQEVGIARFSALPDIFIAEAADNSRPPVEVSSETCAYHRWVEISPNIWKCSRKDCQKIYDYNADRIQNT